MTGEIVNLRLKRKQRARTEAEAVAAANRAAFGIAKPQKDLAKARAALEDSRLAGHRRDRPDESSDA